ncbi:MAG: Fe-S cluster assembly transcriptional regulator IscR [Burkholderiales bacterium]|nr:Fe-S cluster assembly transcriptional regulator IscR [Burkholderiales bacterium]
MRLTTKGRFAVTAMVDVAMHATQSPVPLTEISGRQGISLSYLEQLFSKLRRRALVKSARGPGGGYRLAKPMDAVTVADIIIAVDEPIDATQCGGKENCHDEQKCLTHDLWVRLNDQIFEFLRSVTLAELVEQHRAKETRVVELHDPRMNKRPQSETVPA